MAEFKLTYNDKESPKGKEFELGGVGVVANGSTVTVTQEMQDTWAAQNPDIDMKKALAQVGVVDFHGKDKLVDGAQPLEKVDAEAQAAKGGEE